MIGKQARARGQGRGEVWIAAGLLQALVAFLVYYSTSSHYRLLLAQQQATNQAQSSSTTISDLKPDLNSERTAISERVKAWNVRAGAAGRANEALVLDIASSRALHATSHPAAADGSINRLQAAKEAVQGALGNLGSLGASTQASSAKLPACVEPQDPRYPMKTPAEMAAQEPELAAALAKHAINGEIMFALVNGVMICENKTLCWWDGGNVLESFLQILKHTNVTNYLIGSLDDESAKYLAKAGANWFSPKFVIPAVQKNSHPANRVSTIKYTLLQHIIQLGYNALITDMDLVYLQNPFHHLHRDADVEAQTDGFDPMAYGTLESIQDKTMGWGGGGLYYKMFTTNVGCIYFKANPRTYKLVKRVADQLATHPGWDQQVFNEHLMTLSHGDRDNPYATLRIMDYMKFMNSKIFFRSQRNAFIPGNTSTAAAPIMVHFNYHPDKHKRMLCIMARYYEGKLDACDEFPGGSEPNT